MTIVQPNRSRQITLVIKLLLGGIAGMGVASMLLYNSLVNVRSQVLAQEKIVQELRVENADIKNEYFAQIDSRVLIEVAERLGYIKNLAPKYLTLQTELTQQPSAPGSLTVHTSVYVTQ